MFAAYHAAYVHIPSRGALVYKQGYDEDDNAKIRFVQFSDDWLTILVRPEYVYRVYVNKIINYFF